MSKWECGVCGEKCVLDMVDEQEGFRPVCCPVDNTSGIKPEWLSVDEPVTKCSQLPKLTAEVFDRPDCPEWAKWVCVNSIGDGIYFEYRPQGGKFSTWCNYLEHAKSHIIPGKWDASDWQNSLIQRPEKKNLPDWCKVGKWVYLCNGRYYKVQSVNECHINLSDGVSVGRNDIHSEMISARLRPYNAEEMRRLVGKVVERYSSAYLVISYAHHESAPTILIEGKYLSADNLMRDFTVDGKPCGKLVHKEGDDWVE